MAEVSSFIYYVVVYEWEVVTSVHRWFSVVQAFENWVSDISIQAYGYVQAFYKKCKPDCSVLHIQSRERKIVEKNGGKEIINKVSLCFLWLLLWTVDFQNKSWILFYRLLKCALGWVISVYKHAFLFLFFPSWLEQLSTNYFLFVFYFWHELSCQSLLGAVFVSMCHCSSRHQSYEDWWGETWIPSAWQHYLS